MSLRIPHGVVHKVPMDFRAVLCTHSKALTTWKDITPLARNEWICWIEFAKKSETRKKKLNRACADLSKGKRRPCCWPGCMHR